MKSMNFKPIAVNIVGWCSLLLGLFLALSGIGNIVAQHLNYGGLVEYVAVPQVLAGITMFGSSIYFMKGNRKSRNILEVSLWVALLVSFSVLFSFEPGFRGSAAKAMLQLWIPLGLLIYGVRKKSVMVFVNRSYKYIKSPFGLGRYAACSSYVERYV